MTVAPFDPQALLDRRALLFSPAPRLGWVFRDRWSFRVPFAGPPPVAVPVPEEPAGTPEAARAERSMDDRILSKVCDALTSGGDEEEAAAVSLGRIAAALRALMGEPDDSDLLTRDERRRIANELFSVEYRRRAHGNISRMESYIHPLGALGVECDPAIATLDRVGTAPLAELAPPPPPSSRPGRRCRTRQACRPDNRQPVGQPQTGTPSAAGHRATAHP